VRQRSLSTRVQPLRTARISPAQVSDQHWPCVLSESPANDLPARLVIFHFAVPQAPVSPCQTGGRARDQSFDDVPAHAESEIFTAVPLREEIRVEQIVSTGQSTPADDPHRQGHDEWVLLLAGSAGLRIEGEGARTLRPGDHVLIAAHRAHWVTWTAKPKGEAAGRDFWNWSLLGPQGDV
jgi:cupin 2 domain-containing protein